MNLTILLKIRPISKNPLTTIKSLILSDKGAVRFSSISSSIIEERKIQVKDVEINYAKIGNGEHTVLLLPGMLGTIWSAFKPQMESLDRKNLTIVAWDAPGFGKSRPPNRVFPRFFAYKDADYAHELMKNLGFSRFSLIGFSYGAMLSLIMAGNYPQSIRKIVISGARSYILPREMEFMKRIQNFDDWPESKRTSQIAIYGEDYFKRTWSAWTDAMIHIYEKNNGDICREIIKNIKCPTLIIYGEKDVLVDKEHSKYLLEHISNSRLKLFEKGSHHLHLQYPEEFNQLATQFLLETP